MLLQGVLDLIRSKELVLMPYVGMMEHYFLNKL